MGCTDESTIKYENSKVLFKIDLWELVLQRFEEIPVPSNPGDDNEDGMGTISMGENENNG